MDEEWAVTMPARVIAVDGNGFTVRVACKDADKLLQRLGVVTVRLQDKATITDAKRKEIYATEGDIARWSGFFPSEAHVCLKYDYIAHTGADYFSLSNCGLAVARDYCNYLIDFCLANGVPVQGGFLSRCEDIGRYLYACALHKKCVLTGRKSDLHHVDAVGMGRNRAHIVHLGMHVLTLSREKHEEMHQIGVQTFLDKYHLQTVQLDARLCAVYNLKTGEDKID